jgi:hypothetical protein
MLQPQENVPEMLSHRGYRVGGASIVLGLGLALSSVAYAQQTQSQPAGVILGEVDRCNGGNETPASGVSVGIDGGPAKLAQTDSTGEFVMNVAAGTYTVIATADDGSTASRQYVPVESGISIDIGIIDLGGGVTGCGGFDSGAPAPAPAPAQAQATLPPTVVPTAVPTLPPPTDTPVPPPPTPTPQASSDSGGSPGSPGSGGSGG